MCKLFTFLNYGSMAVHSYSLLFLLGSVLQNFFSAENYSDKFSSKNVHPKTLYINLSEYYD
jgi:uncharacterized membrane protein